MSDTGMSRSMPCARPSPSSQTARCALEIRPGCEGVRVLRRANGPRPHAPSHRAGSRSSEPAGKRIHSRRGPNAAARPPPVRCERSIVHSPKWYTFLITLPHLGITGSRHYLPKSLAGDELVIDPELSYSGGKLDPWAIPGLPVNASQVCTSSDAVRSRPLSRWNCTRANFVLRPRTPSSDPL
jgi:hypothetical protein